MNSDLALLLISDYDLVQQADGSQLLTVEVPPLSKAALIYDIQGIQKMRDEKGLIWVSGGGAYVINNEWVPLVRRSADSYSNPGKLTLASGRASDFNELNHPSLVVRELFEEILIVSRHGALQVPLFKNETPFGSLDIETAIVDSAEAAQIKYNEVHTISAQYDYGLHNDQVRIKREGVTTSDSRAILHINAQNGETNLIYAIKLNTGHLNMSDLNFYDTEREQGQNLDREIYFYHLPSQKYYRYSQNWWQNLESVHLELTEHAQHFIDVLTTKEIKNG